jgi:hypothetical protein
MDCTFQNQSTVGKRSENLGTERLAEEVAPSFSAAPSYGIIVKK